MINRMDNICDAVLKGKWPVNRRHLFDFPSSLLPGHAPASAAAASVAATAAAAAGSSAVADSPLQRRSLAELTMAGLHTPYSSSDSKMSPQLHVSAEKFDPLVPGRTDTGCDATSTGSRYQYRFNTHTHTHTRKVHADITTLIPVFLCMHITILKICVCTAVKFRKVSLF